MGKIIWPGGAKAAITLLYEDGLTTQLEKAIPQLNESGLRGTFFPSGDGLKDPSNAVLWSAAVTAGHEIGAHTINHPCDRAHDFVREGFSLQDYTEERLRDEIRENLEIIKKFGVPAGRPVFAYPCGESVYGEGLKKSYVPIIKEIFLAAKGVNGIIADPEKVDLYDVPCFGITCGTQGMIDIAERAVQCGGWALFLFHGVGGDYISVEADAHREFLRYLAAEKGNLLVAPFGEISTVIENSRAK
ncbi:MAG: polysaccharide deacetylase family protein [Candidatus Goldiibacteriota bacterium]